ncbi:citramalate synthase [Anatilimnocola sp. NA78]|uniref:citramalate synthase n=1 Tax=Anatilimnocola sp. NA78 TaxID=3415683 RepID=UPI003CE51123
MRTIQIYDTTLRDGTQGEGVSLSLEDKLLITRRLDEFGIDFVEGGYPLSNPKDAEYFQRVRDLKLKHAKVCAFGMTRRKGIAAKDDPGMQALVNSQAPVCTVVGKTSDFHVTEILRVSLQENLDMIQDSLSYLKSQGREVFYDAEHFFDGFAANPQYALSTIRTAAEAGASVIILCDTNGGTMPEAIADRTRQALEVLTPLGAKVGIHCHNDCELAVANSLAAVDAGASQVQGTMNGFGERCGNVDLITLVANLCLKKGYSALQPDSLAHLTELSRFVYEVANQNHRNSQPFVGQSAFAHKGGMHVHAIARATSSYEHIDPALVGNERRILVSELSGRSNIAALTAKHKLADNRQLMDSILQRVCDLEAVGYQFEAAEASFDLLVRKVAGTFQPHFERLKYHVAVSAEGESGEPVTEATVKMKVGDTLLHEVAEGDGPVNALDAALRKALNGTFAGLQEMRLIDYKVRVVNGEAGTAAKIRVIIESTDGHDVWGTIGVSENIIEASWLALVDAIEYKLFKDEL